MMPKLIALALRRIFGSMPSIGTPNISRRRHGVNVEPVGEGLAERRRVGHMCQDTKLDLAVIGGDQLLAAVGDEGLADGAAFRSAHRDVLQIRLDRRQPSRRRRGQRIRGVHAARLGMDIGRQRVRVGALQFRQQPPVEHFASAARGRARPALRARLHPCSRRRSWCVCRRAGSSCRTEFRRAASASRY